MQSALFGLVGVGVGAFLTIVSEYIRDRRAERSATAREARGREMTLLQSARLVDSEFALAAMDLRF
jgi:hypothetical protein